MTNNEKKKKISCYFQSNLKDFEGTSNLLNLVLLIGVHINYKHQTRYTNFQEYYEKTVLCYDYNILVSRRKYCLVNIVHKEISNSFQQTGLNISHKKMKKILSKKKHTPAKTYGWFLDYVKFIINYITSNNEVSTIFSTHLIDLICPPIEQRRVEDCCLKNLLGFQYTIIINTIGFGILNDQYLADLKTSFNALLNLCS